jgi:predicted neuraminidase
VYFERSRDFGETWERTSPVNDGIAIQSIQPSILFIGSDKLLAIGRSRQDRIFQVSSDDGGKSWGGMTLGTLPNNNSGTDAVTLKDGTQLIVYNHVGGSRDEWGGKRTPLNVATSHDGKNWNAALVLENDPSEYSYPAVIQTRDGLVHVTYTWKRQRIRHCIIDPTHLKTKSIIDGQWPKGENHVTNQWWANARRRANFPWLRRTE